MVSETISANNASNNNDTSTTMTPESILERQLSAYKLLVAKVAPLPSAGYNLTDIDVGSSPSSSQQECLRNALYAASDYPNALLMDLVTQCLYDSDPANNSNSNSAPLVAKAKETMASLAPPKVSLGILPTDIAAERERLIRLRLDRKLQELTLNSTNNNNADNGNDDIKRQIELKALKLFDQRRRIRAEILQRAQAYSVYDASLNNKLEMDILGRQISLQGIRPFRAPIVTDDSNNMDAGESPIQGKGRAADSRAATRQFCNLFLEHFKQWQLDQKARLSHSVRTAKAVVAFHTAVEKEEQRKAERLSKERIKALKADDEEAYLKLLDQQKDTRLAFLLNQTNQFLGTLSANVRLQQQTTNQEDSMTTGEDEEDRVDYYQAAHRIREAVPEQPSSLVGGSLKEYQLKGLEWLVSLHNNRLNGILADEMGLGKTIQTISLITYLMEKKSLPGPFLVIVPLSTMTNWSVEFEKWAPGIVKVEYKGVPLHRKQLQTSVLKTGRFNVLITTYEYVVKDRSFLSKLKWLYLIIDEGHRMKNSHSKLSQVLSSYYSSRFRLILTGTPLQNNLPELWSLLNFILPKIFNSAKTFEEWFNAPFANYPSASSSSNNNAEAPVELNEEETLLIIRRLHKVLRPFLLRRLKKDVEADLPNKLEIILKCPMSALQQHLYNVVKDETIQHSNHNGIAGEAASFKRLNNTIMQLRKICNHPFTFEDVEEAVNPGKLTNDTLYRSAGKFELLCRAIPKFIAGGHRILIFFQMTQVMTIMEDLMAMINVKYLRLDGSTKSEDRTTLLKLFNDPQSIYSVFLLSTRAGGLGLNLQSADTVIIFDSDWNPHQDLQAQDRAHRIGQTKEVRIFRLVTTDSVEEYILEKAQFKLSLDGKVIQAGKFDHKSTNEEREQMLRAILEGERNPNNGGGEDVKNGSGGGSVEEEEAEVSTSDSEDDDDYLSDDDLNETISRTDQELELFRQLDSSSSMKEKRRLMTIDELPAIYKKKDKKEEQEDAMFDFDGSRRRVRSKVINYDESMSDKKWFEELGGESDEGTVSDNIDSNVEEEEDIPKRIRLTVKQTNNDDDEEEQEEEAVSISEDQVKSLFEVLDEIEMACDEQGRTRADLFLTLPNKRQYPGYYQVIKRPISLQCIRQKLTAHPQQYNSVAEFEEDLNVMFENARQYNAEQSQVYEDATWLQQYAHDLLQNVISSSSPYQ